MIQLRWVLSKLQCIVGSHDQWEFVTFLKGDYIPVKVTLDISESLIERQLCGQKYPG